MATKSTSRNETVWSWFAVILAIISLVYCMNIILESYTIDLPTIFAKFKLLGAG